MSENNFKEVKSFVLKNIVPAKKGTICVDGRYAPKYSGMMARPGGNFREIMTLLALRKKLKLTVGQVVDLAVSAVENMGVTFNMHTDSHADPKDLTSIGCGHIAKAENPETAAMYGVKASDVKQALIYLRIKLEGRKYFNMVNLEGEHKEKGVLVITGSKKTVNHFNPRSKEMYFVFDQKRDEEFTKEFYKNLEINGVSFEEFKKISNDQLTATLRNLAKGLPIYEINADIKDPEIKFVGQVS